MPDNDSTWLAVFSAVDKLEESCAELGIKEYKIVQIKNGDEFCRSVIGYGLRIMLDPFTIRSENKTRWTEVVLP